MELVKAPEKSEMQVAIIQNSSSKTTKKMILDEETYTEEMEKIISRDFFPHLKKLKAQNDYLEALEVGDMAKLQEIQKMYRPKSLLRAAELSLRVPSVTPSTFDTPDVFVPGTPFETTEDDQTKEQDIANTTDCPADEELLSQDDDTKKTKSLDQFLAGTTSEDNASFEEIMVKNSLEHMEKYPWLYKDEEAEKAKVTEQLALPSSDEKPKPGLITWAYKNKNALMYVPDGAEYTIQEKLQFEKRQTIHYDNTRFSAAPFDEQANKAAIAEAASIQAKMKEGHIGIDGKEIVGEESPKVNGYGFIGSPSPEPGVTDTPIMTWGEIEGTPFRLDGGDTPLLQTPGTQQFKMPDIPAREKIALSLADKAAKKKRQKKSEALKHAQSSWLTPSPKFGSSPMNTIERLSSMSPAAQKLVSSKLCIHRHVDKALRASYTPSPSNSPYIDRTPEILAVASPLTKTPRSLRSTKVKVSTKRLTQRLNAKNF